jgi:predicted RNA methylase
VNLFYATFIPGIRNFIETVIKERLEDAIIDKLLEGAVLFRTGTNYNNLNFFCFNNIFAVIGIVNHSENLDASAAIEKHINVFLNGDIINSEIIANNSKTFRTFRIVISCENIPAAINEKTRVETEKHISFLSGLKINRYLPDTEFWFLFRRESGEKQNFSVFMKRLTMRPSWEKTLHKGELPPPLAWTLCRLARIVHSDTVLDPFCGYGSIPDTAYKYFHITNFIACDSNSEAVKYTAAKFKKRKSAGFVLHHTDFNKLTSLVTEKSIDVIVTDPPWGQYCQDAADRADLFYEKMFKVFAKLLKDGGRTVVLSANDESLQKAVPGCFKLQESIPILLSGKKAVIELFSLTA